MIEGFRTGRNDGGTYAVRATAILEGIHSSFIPEKGAYVVVLYRRGAGSPKGRIGFPTGARTGGVWDMTVLGSFPDLEYVCEVDGQQVPDPYGKRLTGMGRWGSPVHLDKPVHAPVDTERSVYGWEENVLLYIPHDQCMIHRVHPRGLTKHVSSGAEGSSRGTSEGMTKKIPCLKDLRTTAAEVIPPVEFEGLIIPERANGNPSVAEKSDGRLNRWGYTRGYYLALKCAYSNGSMRQPEREFKDMVKTLHKTGLELVLGLFFSGKEAPSYMSDVVHFWAQEYHVDGVRLVGHVPMELLGKGPYLGRLKLLTPGWDGVESGQAKHLAEYSDGFMMDMHSFLKGDEDQLNRLAYHIRHNPQQVGAIDYMANTNNFTLIDMVSYDIKHNETGGEDNRDGTDYNQS